MSCRTLDKEMPAILVLVCVLFIHSGITEEEIGSPLRVAQCRARCIQRFTTEGNSEKECPQGTDCAMCWENCQLLQSNFPVWWSNICDEKRICFPGCVEACQFHAEIGGGQSEPVVRTRGEEVIIVTPIKDKDDCQKASWPRPYKATGPFIYVVMRRVGERPWRQIAQSIVPYAHVPKGGLLRVLVVNRVGLVAIYSPAPQQPTSEMAQVKAVLDSVGRGDILGYPIPAPPPQGKRINTQIVLPSTSLPNNNILDDSRGIKRPWDLHEVSLIHQKYLVIAEIAWEGRRQLLGSRKPIYFVTWEVDGGGLKGNLLTESTTVTLSLCTETIYHIQVQVAVREGEKAGERSEELVVDTGKAVAVELDTTGRWADAPRRVPADRRTHELALGFAAALALFLVVALVVMLRTRRTSTPKLLPYQSPSISRVFPPMVHVVEEDHHHHHHLPVSGLPRGTLHV